MTVIGVFCGMAAGIRGLPQGEEMSGKSKVIPILLLVGFVFAAVSWAGDIKGKVTVQGIKSAENIAVYVDAIPAKTFDPPAQHALIDQHGMKFVPKVIVVMRGTTVDFLNSDPVGHNVYWPSINGNKKLAHNLGTWPRGEKKSFQFNDLGAVPLLCNVHPEMSGYLVIAPTPYFAVTDKDGNFEIKGIPAGTYTLKTWSEVGKPSIQTVNLSGETATVELTVKK
jgi:plastocyanin